jgi:FtsH-binding integral membrane protein
MQATHATQHTLKVSAQILIWVHLAVSLLHAVAHAEAAVNLSVLGDLYVFVVILIAPLVALFWLSRSLRWGGGLLALAMAGSLIFGLLNHFILPGIDNVAQVPGIWHTPFAISAYLLAILEAAGTLLGLWIFATTRPSTQPAYK